MGEDGPNSRAKKKEEAKSPKRASSNNRFSGDLNDSNEVASEGTNTPKSRENIPAAMKREIWRRDHSKCSTVNPVTGRKCNSTRFLQIHHIVPIALGGLTVVSNLQLRCGYCNQRAAIDDLGLERMSPYLR